MNILDPEAYAHTRTLSGALVRYVARHKAILFLVAVALTSRLTLLSASLDEVDSANFYNALKYGYNIVWLRPQAPGYPIYVFIGWLTNSIVNDPLLSLTLVSALLGSLAVVPFYLLLREFAGSKIALVGSLLFLVNPMIWSFSEVALSDAPSMFFVLVAAYLAYTGRRSDAAFLSACVVVSLAIGVRQPSILVAVILAFPVAYRLLVVKERAWSLYLLGAVLFSITTLVWFLASVSIGAGSFSEYFTSVSRQWSAAVGPYDVFHMDQPWLSNLLYRLERFFLGYFVTYAWTGTDDKTAGSLVLVAPWLFGFALFVAGFRFREPSHAFLLLWLMSLAYPVLGIHFLARYGLSQLPAFIIAGILGYRFLAIELLRHPRRLESLSLAGIGTLLLLFGIKYQPPVATFEASPPAIEPYVGVFIALGILALFAARWLARPETPLPVGDPDRPSGPGVARQETAHLASVVIFLAFLAVPYAIHSYGLASIAHGSPSPSQRLVEFVNSRYDTERVTPCWDNQTHSFYEAITPRAQPVGYTSVEELYRSYQAGQTLLVSDRCQWYSEINDAIGLSEIAYFDGGSPAWSKVPSVRLFATPNHEQLK